MPTVFLPYLRAVAERAANDERDGSEEEHPASTSVSTLPKRRLVLGAFVAGLAAALAARRLRQARTEAPESGGDETGTSPPVRKRLRRVGKGWVRR